MSSGRRGFPLDGLQDLFRDRPDVVVRGLLDAPTATVRVTPEYVSRPDAVLSPDLPREAFTEAADHAHRTTATDIRLEVRELMLERAPEWEAAIYAFDFKRLEDIPDGMLPGIVALHDRCNRDIRATIPAGRPRKPERPPRMKPRREGPSSYVVTKRADGTLWCEGNEVTPQEAHILLTDPEFVQ